MGIIFEIVFLVSLYYLIEFIYRLMLFMDFRDYEEEYVEEMTLANQEESFINGLIWADVGNDL